MIKLPTLSKTAKVLIGVALCLIVITFVFKSCKITDKTSVLIGQLTAEKLDHAKDVKAANLVIAGAQKDLKAKDELLVLKDKDLARKNETIGQMTNKYGQLREEYVTLTDCPAQRTNLLSQVVLLNGVIGQKDGIISDITDKFNVAVYQKNDALKMYATADLGWKGEVALGETKDALIKSLRHDLSAKKLFGTIKTGLIVVAVGYIVLNVLGK